MDSKASEKRDWVEQHTLSEEDVRRLIAEKIERARLLQLAKINRKLEKELA
jgi:hypothetical protein